MEIRLAIFLRKKFLQRLLPALLLSLLSITTHSQIPVKVFAVKQGNIHVMLSKNLPEVSLDSFILQYDLQELDIKNFLRSGKADSLVKQGWKVELNNGEMLVLTKSMEPLVSINNPEQQIMIAQKNFNGNSGFAIKEPTYGFNRFVRKASFAVRDSTVTFFLRNNKTAKQVKLAGSFTNWEAGAFAMQAVDSGWIANVKLPAGKFYYKFIIDGNWTVDKDNQLIENDGMGNDNSVYYKTNYMFSLAGFTSAKRVYVSGSFNNWDHNGVLMAKTATGWERALYLADGTHTYRFVADGKWFADPVNPEYFPNEFGETNSVVAIGKSYLFSLKGFTDAKKVMLMGSFNQWRNFELPMKKTDSGWALRYTLGHGNYEYTYEVDGKKTAVEVDGKAVLRNKVLVIAPNYTFRLKHFDKAETVCIAGDFNGWSPSGFVMKREGDEWVAPQHLAPGKHVYKFVVDGRWIADPANKLREPNEFNEENSVIWMEE